MGSFNEVCALSGIGINPGTPVKVLFLTRNPHVCSDQKFAERGCYHTDHWFLRTPPIDGRYVDYGQAEFEENYLTKLIEEMFEKDIIARPFGFNQFHARDVPDKPTIKELLDCAWQGRLTVCDEYSRDHRTVKEEFPTWRKVHDILKKSGLKIMTGEGVKGYNAQDVRHGLVFVIFNEYSGTKKKIDKAEKVLKEFYDCKQVLHNKDDYGLYVVPKGAIEDPTILSDWFYNDLGYMMRNHPEGISHQLINPNRQLPVLAVMVRKDVWDAYVIIGYKTWSGPIPSVEEKTPLAKSLFKTKEEVAASSDPVEAALVELRDHGITMKLLDGEFGFMRIPFQMTVSEHLKHAAFQNKLTETECDDFIQRCLESGRVETVMACSFQSWQIPTLGGQDHFFDLKAQLFAEFIKIAKKEEASYNEEHEDAS